MKLTEFQNALASLPLSEEKRAEVLKMAENMTDEEINQLLQELGDLYAGDQQSIQEEQEILDGMENVIAEGEHKVKVAKRKERDVTEQEKRDAEMHDIESKLDSV